MKYIGLYIVIVFMMLSTVGVAQNDTAETQTTVSQSQSTVQKLRIGIYGDIGFSYLKPKSSDFKSLGTRLSYTYGLVVDNNFTDHYTFSTGIRFSSYGGKLEYEDSLSVLGVMQSGMMARKYRVNYLEIPLALKLKTNQMGYFTPFVQVGLNNGFRLSSFSDDDFSVAKTNDIISSEGNDINDITSFYRLALEFGIGTEYDISQSFGAYAVLTYQNGLTNSLTGSTSQGYKQSAMFKKFALTVGFLF